MSRRTEHALGVLLAVLLGICLALLLAHWAACDAQMCAAVLGARLSSPEEATSPDEWAAWSRAAHRRAMGLDPDGPHEVIYLQPGASGAPQAAEACTELGADSSDSNNTSPLAGLALIGIVLVGLVAGAALVL